MNRDSFLFRMLGRDADEDETGIGLPKAFGITRSTNRSVPEVGERQWDFTVALVIETIDDLPSNFPRESAIRIVKRTLAAAGIEVRDFNKCTWARMPQINSEIELARSREKEFQKKTEEDIRSLEEEIKKAREDYQTIRAKEEEEISRASKELENIKRVRAFFGFADMEGDDNVSMGGEAAEEPGPLSIGSVQQGRDPFSSDAFFSSPDVEGEDNNTGPSGAKTDVRDSLDGAWAQIEEIRAQMKRREEGSVDPVPVNEEGTGAEIGEDEVVLPEIEDEVVVDKHPVVKEKKRVRKDVVKDEELVEKDVRKEEVDVDD
jgi:hypothetical protein